MPVELPSPWPDAQRAFHEAYERDPTPWPRTQVRWQVMGGMPGSEPPGSTSWVPAGWIISWVASRLVRRKPVNIDAFIAVFPMTDDSPELIFEFAPKPRSDRGTGVLVGEFAMNGTLALELDDGSVIWPTYNPRHPVTPDKPI